MLTNESSYSILVPPAELPVTLEELKYFLRVDGSDDDSLLTSILHASVDAIESYTGRWLISRTAEGFFTNLINFRFQCYPAIEIERSPLQSVSSFEYFDGNNFINISDYDVQFLNDYSRVFTNSKIQTQKIGSWKYRVEFIAGYGAPSDVPHPLKIAVMQMASFIYENRADCVCSDGSFSAKIPTEIMILIYQYRIKTIFSAR